MNFHDSISWGPGVSLKAVTRFWCQRALLHFKDNKAAAARSLGIDVRTLQSNLDKYAEEDAAAKQAEEKRKADNEDFLMRSRGLAPAMQYDHAASREVPPPQNGLNPVEPIKPKVIPETHKSPLPENAQPAKNRKRA